VEFVEEMHPFGNHLLMTAQLRIDIPKACHEDWSKMKPEEQGRHCALCEKVVVDFSAMSTQELVDFLKSRPKNTCGRFRKDQLRTYSLPSHAFQVGWRPIVALLTLGLTALSLPLPAQNLPDNPTPILRKSYAENPTRQKPATESISVKGKVVDGEGGDLPGVTVSILEAGLVVSTGLDGNFLLNIPADYNQPYTIIRFHFLGYITHETLLSEVLLQPDQIEITMEMEEVVLLGEVITGGVRASAVHKSNRSLNYWVNRGWGFIRRGLFGWL